MTAFPPSFFMLVVVVRSVPVGARSPPSGDFLTLYVLVAIPLFVSFQHIENMHAVSPPPAAAPAPHTQTY